MSSQFYSSYHVTSNTVLSAELWNSVFQNIDLRILGIEEKKASFEVAEQQLLEVGLRRINETLTPAAQKIMSLSELGFMVASSDEMIKPVDGQTLSLHLIKGTQSDLFMPSPFVALVRRSTPEAYAIGQLLHYDRDLARVDMKIVSVQGVTEPYDDFDIAALAGSVKAMWDALAESRAIRDDVQVKHSDIVTKAADVSVKQGQVQNAHDEILTAKEEVLAAAAQVSAIADFDPTTKLDKAGGTITGQLTVNGQLVSNIGIKVGTGSEIAEYWSNGNIYGNAWKEWDETGFAKQAIDARIEERVAAIADAKITAALNAFKASPTFTGTVKVTGEIKATGNIKAFTS